MISKELQRLKAENERLKSELEQEVSHRKNACSAYDYLLQQFNQLKRAQFGSRSEKYNDPDHPQQSLFDDRQPESENNTISSDESNVVDISSYKRRKKKRNKEPIKRVIIIPATDKVCRCGREKKVIRHEVREFYHHQPAVFEKIEQRREVVACASGCSGSIDTAKCPKHVLPKIKASHSLLSHIIVSKFIDRQPLYHLEKQFKQRFGVNITRQQMANWLIILKPKLQPLLNLLKDEIINYDVASMDATGLQVLREPGRPPTRKSYAYCFRGGAPGKKVVILEYNAENHKHYVANWFTGFQGFIHSDADPFFNLLASQSEANLSLCNTHARRKFEPIAKAVKTDDASHHAMRVYRKLYKIEREAKNNNMTPHERYELRLKKSKPILDEFKLWLDKTYPTTLVKSALGKAFQYVIKHWDGLIRFLDDGRLEIDNNLTEQEIKMFVIIRKNFLFCTSVAGAQALCAHFSLLRTAIANGHEPYRYIKAVLDALPSCQTLEDYEALLPWNLERDQTTEQQAA